MCCDSEIHVFYTSYNSRRSCSSFRTRIAHYDVRQNRQRRSVHDPARDAELSFPLFPDMFCRRIAEQWRALTDWIGKKMFLRRQPACGQKEQCFRVAFSWWQVLTSTTRPHRCTALYSLPPSSPRARSLSLAISKEDRFPRKLVVGIVPPSLARLDSSPWRVPPRQRAQVRPRQRLWSEPPLPSLRLRLNPLRLQYPFPRALLPPRHQRRPPDRSNGFRSTRTTQFERCTALYPSPGIPPSVLLLKPNSASN